MPQVKSMPRQKKTSRVAPLVVDCVKLPGFNVNDFQDTQHAFQSLKTIPMRQAWRTKEESGFSPGFVRIGWHDNALLVFAELADVDFLTRAKTTNERLWELGDSFEIFLQPVDQSSYIELQVAPNNCQLQLRYPNPVAVEEARKANDFKPYLIPHDSFYSASWVRPAESRWFVFAKIPRDLVCEKHNSLEGKEWRFSFSRYDYTSNQGKPVVSSTSPHTTPEFHSQNEWGTMRFRSNS
jgi:Carbohydrate family 9 binding domain-like